MSFANLSLADTFFQQIIRLNEHTVFLNNLTSANVFTVRSNTAAISVTGNSQFNSTIYLNVNPTQNPSDNSASNIASANMVNTALNAFSVRFGSDFSNLSTKVASDSSNSVNTVIALSNSVNSSIANGVAVAYNQANAAYNAANAAAIAWVGPMGGINTQISGINSTISLKANSFSYASVPELRGNAGSNVLTTANVFAADSPVNLGNIAGSISLDFGSFFNANAVMTANVTFNLASNVTKGIGGTIELLHSGLPRTVTVNPTYFSTSGNSGLSLSSTAGVRDLISWYVLSTGKVFLSPSAFNV